MRNISTLGPDFHTQSNRGNIHQEETRVISNEIEIDNNSIKEKEAFKPSKSVVRDHGGAQFISYTYNIKGYQAIIQKGRKQ